MRKLRILCDMDAIVANLSEKWVERYNRDYKTSLTVMDMSKSWHMRNNVPYGKDKVQEYLYENGFFLDLNPLPGALESLALLKARGHHIVFVSSPSWPGTSASDKITWLRTHAPFIPKRDIILAHHKHLVIGDVFIDDSPDNIRQYRKWHPRSFIATIAYPYNLGVRDKVNVYAESSHDTQRAWKRIKEAVNVLAGDEIHQCILDDSYPNCVCGRALDERSDQSSGGRDSGGAIPAGQKVGGAEPS